MSENQFVTALVRGDLEAITNLYNQEVDSGFKIYSRTPSTSRKTSPNATTKEYLREWLTTNFRVFKFEWVWRKLTVNQNIIEPSLIQKWLLDIAAEISMIPVQWLIRDCKLVPDSQTLASAMESHDPDIIRIIVRNRVRFTQSQLIHYRTIPKLVLTESVGIGDPEYIEELQSRCNRRLGSSGLLLAYHNRDVAMMDWLVSRYGRRYLARSCQRAIREYHLEAAQYLTSRYSIGCTDQDIMVLSNVRGHSMRQWIQSNQDTLIKPFKSEYEWFDTTIQSFQTGVTYSIIRFLGNGGYGCVYEGVAHLNPPVRVAIKILNSDSVKCIVDETAYLQLWSSNPELSLKYGMGLRDVITRKRRDQFDLGKRHRCNRIFFRPTDGHLVGYSESEIDMFSLTYPEPSNSKSRHVYLVYDFIQGFTGYSYLTIKSSSRNREISIASQLIRGLDWFHRLGIYNSDIKTTNVIFSPNSMAPRYIDWGNASMNPLLAILFPNQNSKPLSKIDEILSTIESLEYFQRGLDPLESTANFLLHNRGTFQGSYRFSSPELMDLESMLNHWNFGDNFDIKTVLIDFGTRYGYCLGRSHDIWSLGCVLLEWYTDSVQYRSKHRSGYHELSPGILSKRIANVEPECIRRIIELMLVFDPLTRINNWNLIMKQINTISEPDKSDCNIQQFIINTHLTAYHAWKQCGIDMSAYLGEGLTGDEPYHPVKIGFTDLTGVSRGFNLEPFN